MEPFLHLGGAVPFNSEFESFEHYALLEVQWDPYGAKGYIVISI